MDFDWTSRTVAEWREYLKRVPRANFLQSLPFARAARLRDQKVTRLALIRKDGEAIGMAAIQEVKLGPIHVLNLYRGPLWFVPEPPHDWLAEFAVLFNRSFPRRWLRRRRWMPEWPDGAMAQGIMRRLGFRGLPQSYATVWLNLRDSDTALRAQLKQKWRNALNKGERANVQVKIDWTGATAAQFLHQYGIDRATKKYRARAPSFIKEEIAAAVVFKEAMLLWGVLDGQAVAAILVLLHGQSATYRVGWTTTVGREANAHNVLLWEAVKALKQKGLGFFDLGGIEPMGAEGLTHFKAGMGGEGFKLVGVFS